MFSSIRKDLTQEDTFSCVTLVSDRKSLQFGSTVCKPLRTMDGKKEGIWDRFVYSQYRVKVYTLRPLMRILCRKGIFRSDDVTYSGCYGFTLGGGFEHGRLLFVERTSMFMQCKDDSDRCWPCLDSSKLERKNVLLEINGHQLCGMPSNYAHKIMEQSWKRGDALIVTVYKHLAFEAAFRGDILISNLINNNWHPPQHPARQMQYTTRENIYSMYPPITNRPREEKEPGPDEGGYYFASDAEINYWLVNQCILEHGKHKGYFYGTYCPRHSRDNSLEGHANALSMTNFRGRRLSFKKAIRMVPNDFDEQIRDEDLDPRSLATVYHRFVQSQYDAERTGKPEVKSNEQLVRPKFRMTRVLSSKLPAKLQRVMMAVEQALEERKMQEGGGAVVRKTA